MFDFIIDLFDPAFQFIGWLLSFFYDLPVIGGSYGVSIILLTFVVMLVVMPLTLKATRSTIAMQRVQPEMRALQEKHKGDRATLNTETMALYQKHGINPLGGCLPIVAQLPVFLVLYRIFIGLTNRNSETPFFAVTETVRAAEGLDPLPAANFNPRWVPIESQISLDLIDANAMPFGPFDLAARAADVFQANPINAIPYILLILFVVAGSYYQQRQVMSRRNGEPMMAHPMQQQMMRILPLMSGVWGFIFPAALVLYWATSNAFRIGQQYYITRSFYSGEDSIGRQAAAAAKKPATPDDGVEDKPQAKKNETTKDSSTEKSENDTSKSSSKDGRTNGMSAKRDRNQEWAARRNKKSKVQKHRATGTTSSRVTPKGTKASPVKKKRKR